MNYKIIFLISIAFVLTSCKKDRSRLPIYGLETEQQLECVEALTNKMDLLENFGPMASDAHLVGYFGEQFVDLYTVDPPATLDEYIYLWPNLTQVVNYSGDSGITSTVRVGKLTLASGGENSRPIFEFDLILPGDDLLVTLVNLTPGEEIPMTSNTDILNRALYTGASAQLLLICDNTSNSVILRLAPFEGNRMTCTKMEFEATQDSVFIEGGISFDLMMSRDAVEAEEYYPIKGDFTFRIADAL